ncbi:MAG: hypothetical protein MR239_01360 [Clostridiales bacterium]|jgi:hypothetical protein|nr:hypothetical protein [Clostridiales bacterium]MDY4655341.1 hypothetical protein [Eubacteriales bacterium]
MKKEKKNLTERELYNVQAHNLGRIFTWVALGLICLLPVIYWISAGVWPDWKAFAKCIPFMLGYVAIGLIEAVSYAPLLGTGGQYMSFITGNVSNLKLPCALNAQNICETKQGSEEQEIITTISIAVSSIVTTLVIVIGLIPLIIFQSQIVTALAPVSPYVIPAIFGGLTLVLIASYFKIAVIPFIVCIIICVVGNLIGYGEKLSQSTMVIVGMVVSGISTTILYKCKKL